MTTKPSCIYHYQLLLSFELTQLTLLLANDRRIVMLTTGELCYSIFNTLNMPILIVSHCKNLLLM